MVSLRKRYIVASSVPNHFLHSFSSRADMHFAQGNGRIVKRLHHKEHKKFFRSLFWEWERARAGIEHATAAPSQPDCPGVSRSDHSAGSKESASWRALGDQVHLDWHGRLGVGKREKEGKEASGRSRRMSFGLTFDRYLIFHFTLTPRFFFLS